MSDDNEGIQITVSDDGTVTTAPYVGKLAYVILVEPQPTGDVGKTIADAANEYTLAGETKADVEALVSHLSQRFPDHEFKLDWFGEEPSSQP